MSVVEEAAKGHVVVTSSSSSGMLVTMNAWVDPSNIQTYIKECQVVQKKFLDHPDNLFCALSVNPKDASHVRIVSGWKGDSEWFGKVCGSDGLSEYISFPLGLGVG
jgi:hypothetical protein